MAAGSAWRAFFGIFMGYRLQGNRVLGLRVIGLGFRVLGFRGS